MTITISSGKSPRSYVDFPWLRWHEGFKLESRRHVDIDYWDQFLVLAEDGTSAQVYYPLDEYPELVFEFSKLTRVEDVLKFANKFGFIGFEYRHSGDASGESVSDWLLESAKIKETLEIWFATENKDRSFLRKVVRWDEQVVWAVNHQKIKVPIAWRGPGSVVFEKWKQGDLIAPARFYIQEQVNAGLSGTFSIRLSTTSSGEMAQHLSPVDLLSALWLQISQILTGQKKIRPCDVCGRQMDISENRSHKRVHDACSLRRRMAKYRKSLGSG